MTKKFRIAGSRSSHALERALPFQGEKKKKEKKKRTQPIKMF